MRTETYNIFTFEELSPAAKKTAIESLRQRCFCANSEWIWSDARETINAVEEIGHCRLSIQESSQGYYIDHAHNLHEEYELSDEEKFEKFRKDFIEQFKERIWCDNVMLKVIQEYKFQSYRSYVNNVGCAIINFCKVIDDNCLVYFKDENVQEWILQQEIEFFENGKEYRL